MHQKAFSKSALDLGEKHKHKKYREHTNDLNNFIILIFFCVSIDQRKETLYIFWLFFVSIGVMDTYVY